MTVYRYVVLSFEPPTPPHQKLKGTLTFFHLFLAYFRENIITDMDMIEWGLGLVRPKLLM